jgi:hypothetical protein
MLNSATRHCPQEALPMIVVANRIRVTPGFEARFERRFAG